MAALEVSQRAYEARLTLQQRVDAENAARSAQFAAIDSILAAAVDAQPFRIADFITPAEHPPFDPGGLDKPTPKPKRQAAPPEPVYEAPPPLSGLSKMFGKKQHLEAEEAAKAKWRDEHAAWTKLTTKTIPARNRAAEAQHEADENERRARLAEARAKYDEECAEREETALANTKSLEEFAARVKRNDAAAVQEFIDGILESSHFPDAFQGSFETAYDNESHEATVNLYVPAPDSMPKIKSQKVTSTNELRDTVCSQTEQRNRYNNAVAATAIRVLHQLFSAEPAGIIETVSLMVGTETIDPATGQEKLFRFVAAAAAREDFAQLNLSNVEPSQTLIHLGAVVSKNAFALKPISDIRGIRK